MVLKVEHFWKWNRNTLNVVVYGASEGWSSVGMVVQKNKNCYIELRRKGTSYIQQNVGRLLDGSILRRKCPKNMLLKERYRIEVTLSRRRRCKQLLYEIKGRRRYWDLNQKSLDCTMEWSMN
jgi:hypothetical protein